MIYGYEIDKSYNQFSKELNALLLKGFFGTSEFRLLHKNNYDDTSKDEKPIYIFCSKEFFKHIPGFRKLSQNESEPILLLFKEAPSSYIDYGGMRL